MILLHFLHGSVDWNNMSSKHIVTDIVTSYTEVWIEIYRFASLEARGFVTSYTEVWIEILQWISFRTSIMVTSYTEVWIEMENSHVQLLLNLVTSYTEVWIEIPPETQAAMIEKSLPTRKCGLKSGWFWETYFNDNSQEYYTNITDFGVITVVAFNKNR